MNGHKLVFLSYRNVAVMVGQPGNGVKLMTASH